MATIYANAQGEILRLLHNEDEEAQFPTAPAGTAFTLKFDEATNAGLLTSFDTNSNAFTMPGGTLTAGGVASTINPPTTYYAARQNLPALLAKLSGTDPFTRADLAQLFRLVLRHVSLLPAGT